VKGLWQGSSAPSTLKTKAQTLENTGYFIDMYPSKITIIYVGADSGIKVTVAEVELKADALKLAMQGKVGALPHSVVALKISALIDHAYEHFLVLDPTSIPSTPTILDTPTVLEAHMNDFKAEIMATYYENGNKIAAIKLFRQKMSCSLKFAKDTVETWIEEDDLVITDYQEMGGVTMKHDTESVTLNPHTDWKYASVTADPMELCDAKRLHQPIKGTSLGSRYFVVALGDYVKVAARIKNAQDISIRAECTAGLGTKEQMETIEGFKRAGLEASAGSHWSLHLHPTNMTMAERCIGSTLFAFSLPFTGVSGNLKALMNK